MKDNRGLSLVELLVGLALSSIVLVAIGYLLITGLRLSGRNNAHVEVQNEAQTTMNLIIDNIMESRGICAVNSAAGADTQCILLGDLLIEASGGAYDVYFSGDAVVTDIHTLGADGQPLGEMYLVAFPNQDFPEDGGKPGYCKLLGSVSVGGTDEAVKKGTVAQSAWTLIRDYVTGLSQAQRTQWLLARYITGCTITVDDFDISGVTGDYYKETTYYWNGDTEDTYYYDEPMTLQISIDLEYDYGNGTVTRNLTDSVALRNRLNQVYVGDGSAMYEYKLKK